MYNETTRVKIPKEGFVGGIILDESLIPEDLQIEKKRDGVEFIGFIDKGEEANTCVTLRAGIKEKNEKKRNWENIFFNLFILSLTGFRFPFAHFISDIIQGFDIHMLFWEAVDRLQMLGVLGAFASMDGAANNR